MLKTLLRGFSSSAHLTSIVLKFDFFKYLQLSWISRPYTDDVGALMGAFHYCFFCLLLKIRCLCVFMVPIIGTIFHAVLLQPNKKHLPLFIEIYCDSSITFFRQPRQTITHLLQLIKHPCHMEAIAHRMMDLHRER